MKFDRSKMIEALNRVILRMHYPLEVMLVYVCWYAAYPLSFRHIEEMTIPQARDRLTRPAREDYHRKERSDHGCQS